MPLLCARKIWDKIAACIWEEWETVRFIEASVALCRAAVQDAIKAALSQSIEASSGDEQDDGLGTSASNASCAKAQEAKVCAQLQTL